MNLIKLCVGCESVEDLASWQEARWASRPDWQPIHVTRMWPKRGDEILAGGSLYWIIKGQVACRQRIIDLVEVPGEDGVTRCGLVLDREITRTSAAPRRPFQGWRYLKPEDAPRDLAPGAEHDDTLPPELAAKLSDFGIL